MNVWRKGFPVGQHLQSSYRQVGLNLTECNLLVTIERVRVRTNCSRQQDFGILSGPLTNSERPQFGPMRTVWWTWWDVCVGLGCVYTSLLTSRSLFRLSFRLGRKELVRKEWGEQDPWIPWPQIPRLSLVIVYNFCISCSISSCCLP